MRSSSEMWATTPGIVESTASPVVSSGVKPSSTSTTAIMPTSLMGMSALPGRAVKARWTAS